MGERSIFTLARVLAALVGTLFVLVALLYSGYLNYTDLNAPQIDVTRHQPEVDVTGRRVVYGRSDLTRQGRLWFLHLEGSPEELGDAHGKLAGRLLLGLHEQVTDFLAGRYGAFSEAWAANMLLRWHYRDGDTHLPPSDRRELAALAAAVPEAGAGNYGPYHLLFLYQCFEELAQRLQDVVVQGDVFAVGPRRTAGGRGQGNLVVGRSLTADLGHAIEPERVVTFYYPDGKYPFVSIGWAGLVGVVTGINARGITVALNPARTDDPLEEGAPLPLVLRKVLEEADTAERAVEILEHADLRSSGIVLIGDGIQRKALVMEVAARDPDERRVVRGEEQAIVWATDHMVREVFERDPQNDRVRRDTSSGYRYQRLAQLLEGKAPLTPIEAVTILRDRRGLDDSELGLGNRNALENLFTTHSVVIDATAMVMWVAEGPSTLGRYRAIDLRHALGRQGRYPAPLDDLPADPLLYSEEYRDFQQALESMTHARFLMARGEYERALWSAQIGLALAPDIGDLHRVLGDIQRELGDFEGARTHYRRYLELVPGRLRDRERVRGILAELDS